jgi:hypothetical protein
VPCHAPFVAAAFSGGRAFGARGRYHGNGS